MNHRDLRGYILSFQLYPYVVLHCKHENTANYMYTCSHH